jgi:hypothetical protein
MLTTRITYEQAAARHRKLIQEAEAHRTIQQVKAGPARDRLPGPGRNGSP